MTIRITQSEIVRSQLLSISNNREQVDKYSNQISSGLKVVDPGDSNIAGSIAGYQDTLARVSSYESRISTVKGYLQFQDDALAQVNDLLVRAKELATQGASETVDSVKREEIAGEVMQIRDNLVQIANSKYQGKYIFGGNDDGTQPFTSTTYTDTPTPTNSLVGQHWTFNSSAGASQTRSVNIAENLSVTLNQTSGGQMFTNAINAIERMGRSLAGYPTLPAPPAAPNVATATNQYTAAQFHQQTTEIQQTIDLLDTARQSDIMTARVTLASEQRRLDTGDALLKLTKTNMQDRLAKEQQTDVAEAATSLATAQNALQASYTVSSKVLNLSIMDFL